jgi:drug/metabolite transporter (DMT)-like permease
MRGAAMNKAMGPFEWSLLGALSGLWGGSFFFAEVALAEIPPLTLVLARVALAAVALHLALVATGRRFPRGAALWGSFLAMGALNNLIPFGLIFWGQTRIAGGLAAILNATTPLWTVVLAHLFTNNERLTANRLGGVLLGLAGVTVMIGPTVAIGGLGVDVIAQLAVVAGALSYACAGIYGRRFRDVPPLVTAAGQLTATTLLMAPIVLAFDAPWTLPTPSAVAWGAVAGLALLSTTIAYVIYFRLLATVGATNLLLVTFLIPVSALLLGVTILGERLEPRQLAGMALIGLGLAAIDGRPLALLRPRGRRQSAGVRQAPIPPRPHPAGRSPRTPP